MVCSTPAIQSLGPALDSTVVSARNRSKRKQERHFRVPRTLVRQTSQHPDDGGIRDVSGGDTSRARAVVCNPSLLSLV
jgi:hypothetical protein